MRSHSIEEELAEIRETIDILHDDLKTAQAHGHQGGHIEATISDAEERERTLLKAASRLWTL